MIIGNILGYAKGNSNNIAIRQSCTHIGLVVEIGHGGVDGGKRCYNPNAVRENSFADRF